MTLLIAPVPALHFLRGQLQPTQCSSRLQEWRLSFDPHPLRLLQATTLELVIDASGPL
jgi:hypothetical protein